MIRKIMAIVRLLCWAWQNRAVIGIVLADLDNLRLHVKIIRGMYKSNTAKIADVQAVLLDFLDSPSFNAIITTTETNWDDEQFARVKDFVKSDLIFTAAWKILRKQCKINLTDGSNSEFVRKLQSILPYIQEPTSLFETKEVFVCANDATVNNTQSVVSDTLSLDGEAETGVLTTISLIVTIITVLPKVLEIMRKRRDKKKNA